MAINLVRVINQQTIANRSILLDKIDRSQGNFTGYANRAKQKLYVPYKNPVDLTVKGYVDLVPTDEVLLQLRDGGVIAGLAAAGRVTYGLVSSDTVAAPVITAGLHDLSDGLLTITGTTFTSVAPDLTYVIATNAAGVSQTIPATAFNSHSATTITLANADFTIGVPATTWTIKVLANSKLSNAFTLTQQA